LLRVALSKQDQPLPGIAPAVTVAPVGGFSNFIYSLCMWNKEQIFQHKQAVRILEHILTDAFLYIKNYKNCTELNVQNFILEEYKKNKLKTALGKPIVAFGASSAFPHYDPSQGTPRTVKNGDVIKIDVWARLNKPHAPYGDITWMGYKGRRAPKTISNIFESVLKARDASVKELRNKLRNKKIPTGKEVDAVAMDVLLKSGGEFRKQILHTTGHSIGTTSPHGVYGAVSSRNKNKLKKNLGYTIEPGLYYKNRYGFRSEINCYITSEYKLIITTKPQRTIFTLGLA